MPLKITSRIFSKSFISVPCLLLVIFLLSNNPVYGQTAIPPSDGDGSSGTPYQIETLENLYWLSQNPGEWGKAYVQSADIDASESSTWDFGMGFSPIGNGFTPFSGTYDGGDMLF